MLFISFRHLKFLSILIGNYHKLHETGRLGALVPFSSKRNQVKMLFLSKAGYVLFTIQMSFDTILK